MCFKHQIVRDFNVQQIFEKVGNQQGKMEDQQLSQQNITYKNSLIN